MALLGRDILYLGDIEVAEGRVNDMSLAASGDQMRLYLERARIMFATDGMVEIDIDDLSPSNVSLCRQASGEYGALVRAFFWISIDEVEDRVMKMFTTANGRNPVLCGVARAFVNRAESKYMDVSSVKFFVDDKDPMSAVSGMVTMAGVAEDGGLFVEGKIFVAQKDL